MLLNEHERDHERLGLNNQLRKIKSSIGGGGSGNGIILPRLDQIQDPDASHAISMGGNTLTWDFTNPIGGMLFNMTGGWSGHVFEIMDTSVSPSAVDDHLLHLETSRENVLPGHFVNNHADGRALHSEGKTMLDGDVILELLKDKSILGTDSDGKIIEGTHQDISGLVPYTGATNNVDLGSQNLTTTGDITADNIYTKDELKVKQVVFNLIGDVGEQAWVRVPYNSNIVGWELTADSSGSAQIDIWKDTFANFPPTNANTITGGNEPELSTQQTNSDDILTSWTTSVNEGDYLLANVDSSDLDKLVLIVKLERT